MTRSLAAIGGVLALALLPACDGEGPEAGPAEATPTVVLSASPSESAETTETEGSEPVDDPDGIGPEVAADDQPLVDGTVTVATRRVPGPAFVVLHRDEGGAPGPVIGYAGIEAGDQEAVPVTLDEDVEDGATLWAMLHTDAGERGVYEFPGPDVPLRDAEGAVVMVPFAVTTP